MLVGATYIPDVGHGHEGPDRLCVCGSHGVAHPLLSVDVLQVTAQRHDELILCHLPVWAKTGFKVTSIGLVCSFLVMGMVFENLHSDLSKGNVVILDDILSFSVIFRDI